MNARRIPIALAVTATSLSLAATPALAKGGISGGGGSGGGSGSGGGQTLPPPPDVTTPDPAWSLCPDYAQVGFIKLADGSTTFANIAPGAACLVARVETSGALSIYQLNVFPGWVTNVRSAGGGDQNKIDVEFFNPTTNEKHSILVEPGKTVIR